MIREIKNNDLTELNAAPFAVVDFNATWCGPCKMLAPVIEELANEMEGEAAFFSLDVDENMDTAQKFRIMSVPSILVFKNGELVNTAVGFQPKPQLQAWINSCK